MPWPMTMIFMLFSSSDCVGGANRRSSVTGQAYGDGTASRKQHQGCEDHQGLLNVARALHQESGSDRPHIAAGADDAGHAAPRPVVDKWHQRVSAAAGH